MILLLIIFILTGNYFQEMFTRLYNPPSQYESIRRFSIFHSLNGRNSSIFTTAQLQLIYIYKSNCFRRYGFLHILFYFFRLGKYQISLNTPTLVQIPNWPLWAKWPFQRAIISMWKKVYASGWCVCLGSTNHILRVKTTLKIFYLFLQAHIDIYR